MTRVSPRPQRVKRPKLEIGWRERVALPELGIDEVVSKTDTGARTSALHAVDLKPMERNGEEWIRFRIPLGSKETSPVCRARVLDRRRIKNSSGASEIRYVIRTHLVMGDDTWTIDVSLADRGSMVCPLILGRTAIRNRRIVVNPGRSFLTGTPALNGTADR